MGNWQPWASDCLNWRCSCHRCIPDICRTDDNNNGGGDDCDDDDDDDDGDGDGDDDDGEHDDTDDQDRHEESKGACSKAEREKVKLAILPGGVHLGFTRLLQVCTVRMV